MEIITELEPHARGVYAGGVGYFGAGGDMDTCIALRTAVFKGGKITCRPAAGSCSTPTPKANSWRRCTRPAPCSARPKKPRAMTGEPLMPPPFKVLLIDNYDSFTYNLVHYLQDI